MSSTKIVGPFDRRRLVRRCVNCKRLRRGAGHSQKVSTCSSLTSKQCDGHFPCSQCLSRGVECHGPMQQIVSSPTVVLCGPRVRPAIESREDILRMATTDLDIPLQFSQFVHAPYSPFAIVFASEDCQRHLHTPAVGYIIRALFGAGPNHEESENLNQTAQDATWARSIRHSLSRNLDTVLSQGSADRYTVMLSGVLTAICQVSSSKH